MSEGHSDALSAAQEVGKLLEAAISKRSERFALCSRVIGAGDDRTTVFMIAEAGKPPTFPLILSVRPLGESGNQLHVDYQYINARTGRAFRGVVYAASRAKSCELVRAFVSAVMGISLPK